MLEDSIDLSRRLAEALKLEYYKKQGDIKNG
jgi:hypothetical protein